MKIEDLSRDQFFVICARLLALADPDAKKDRENAAREYYRQMKNGNSAFWDLTTVGVMVMKGGKLKQRR